MSGYDKFWVSVWGIVAAGLLGVVLIAASYWKDHNEKLVRLIEQGVDPVAAMCVMQDDYGKNPVCIVLATKK